MTSIRVLQNSGLLDNYWLDEAKDSRRALEMAFNLPHLAALRQEIESFGFFVTEEQQKHLPNNFRTVAEIYRSITKTMMAVARGEPWETEDSDNGGLNIAGGCSEVCEVLYLLCVQSNASY